MRPTISAIIPTYNRRPYLGRAIQSILSQSIAPDEILVIDDGSTDGTADYLRKEFPGVIRLVEQTNAGVSAARRRGLLEARHDWIAFLDSDDEWSIGRLQALLTAAENLPEDVRWIFGDTSLVFDNEIIQSLYQIHGLGPIYGSVIYRDPIETQFPFSFSLLQSSLISRNLLTQLNAFSEQLKSSEDFLVSFRASLHGPLAAIPDIVTRLYRTSDLADSSLDQAGKSGPDYFRARILAFDEATRLAGSKPWSRLHEEAVRGLCRALADQNSPSGLLALQQFKHRISAKAIGFSLMAIPGSTLLSLINMIRQRFS